MTKKKKRVLPNIEVLIIGVFIISFFLMVLPKCESTREEYQQIAQDTAAVDTMIRENFAVPPPPEPEVATPAEGRPTLANGESVLYVTIDKLKFRAEPHVASRVLKEFDLFEEVIFLNEVTEKKKEVDWGDGIITNEPWIKIKSAEGKTGWAYGAGLYFYKRKFGLPEEETAQKEE
ncbi:MAG: SH3 domain-containing protein [Bacteroidota bacterium]